MPSMIVRRAAVGLALVTALAGCSGPRLAVPDTLPAEPLAVDRPTVRTPSTGLSFGPYAAVDVDRSWTRGRGASTPRAGAAVERQSYAFAFVTDGAPWDVACETDAHDVTLRGPVDVELASGATLSCTLRPTGADPEARAWRLDLRRERDRPLRGELVHRDGVFEIAGTRKTAGGLPLSETTGYHFRREGAPAAAVEIVGRGAVWLGERLAGQDRDAVAAAAAALLLLQELDADLAVR